MKQYRDLLQKWLDLHKNPVEFMKKTQLVEIDGEFDYDFIRLTRRVLKTGGFPCTCERCTGIPDIESFYEGNQL